MARWDAVNVIAQTKHKGAKGETFFGLFQASVGPKQRAVSMRQHVLISVGWPIVNCASPETNALLYTLQAAIASR